MIDFQTEYTKELHEKSDYPKIDFELIRKHFKEWEHHKVEDIMTYRNKSFSSPVTGSVAPIHHTPWASAMDDSPKVFLDQPKNIYLSLLIILRFSSLSWFSLTSDGAFIIKS